MIVQWYNTLYLWIVDDDFYTGYMKKFNKLNSSKQRIKKLLKNTISPIKAVQNDY